MCQTILWSRQGSLHEQVSVSLDKWKELCILMQYEIELMYTFETIAFYFICIIYSYTKWLWCGNLILVRISL